ncbi:MAG: acyltransferase family protein [Sphingomonas sp.]
MKSHRFLALDSLRGICACIVVVFHLQFNLQTTGPLTSLAVVNNGWLFVDFFFVLSGFVIAASYGERLAQGFSVRRFMFLRLGRLYPLHLAMILVFLALELAAMTLGTGGLTSRAMFDGVRSLWGLFLNLSLTQIFGFDDKLTWNMPSWSIAAEIWTYLLAALALRFAGRGLVPVILFAVAASAAALLVAGNGLEHHYSFSLVRCIYAFGLGVLGWQLYQARIEALTLPAKAATALEIGLVAACFALISLAPLAWTLLCPPLFVLLVLVFARESGGLSRMLKVRPLIFVGTLSYSIYMVHMFVEGRTIDALTIVGRITGLALADVAVMNGVPVKMITLPGLYADLLAVAVVALVIFCSWVSYRIVERPCRELSRRYAARYGAGAAEALAPAF